MGLYIEDSDLVKMAELPFTREISFSTAKPRNLDSSILNRTFRNFANQLKLTLETQAKVASIHATFKTVRGERKDILTEESRNAHIVILPGSLVPGSGQHEHPAVVAILDHQKPESMLLNIAISLARKEHSELTLVCGSDESLDIAKNLAAKTDLITHTGRYRDNSALIDYLRRIRPRAIVINEDHSLLTAEQRIHLLSQLLKCDMYIIRSSEDH